MPSFCPRLKKRRHESLGCLPVQYVSLEAEDEKNYIDIFAFSEDICSVSSEDKMAVSLVSSLQCSIKVSAVNIRGDLGIETGKKANKEYELSSTRWLGPTTALYAQGPGNRQLQRKSGFNSICAVIGKDEPEDGDNEPSNDVDAELFRQQMERMVSSHDDRFEGKDLATLIRKKYGRSYDVQLIKKEFLGRQLLAMNVMWKYREQRSFPLTEEEYLLHLDHVAQNLRGWGAVSYVRDSLERTRERPRIGKAVSIFIEVDETGSRQNEWIQR